MQIFPLSPWHVYLSFITLKYFPNLSVVTFLKVIETYINYPIFIVSMVLFTYMLKLNVFQLLGWIK